MLFSTPKVINKNLSSHLSTQKKLLTPIWYGYLIFHLITMKNCSIITHIVWLIQLLLNVLLILRQDISLLLEIPPRLLLMVLFIRFLCIVWLVLVLYIPTTTTEHIIYSSAYCKNHPAQATANQPYSTPNKQFKPL